MICSSKMICSISGVVPEEPVVSKKSGFLYEKRLIERHITDYGKCPDTGEPLSMEDIVPIKISKCVKPRPVHAARNPELLKMFQLEWDELFLSHEELEACLATTRKEYSHMLYHLDTASRVYARVKKEIAETRSLLAQAGRQIPMSTSASIAENASEDDELGPDGKKLRPGISSKINEELTDCSAVLSQQRKKKQFSGDKLVSMYERKPIDLGNGWEFVQKGITKLRKILDGFPEPQFRTEEYMMLYTTIYNMCTENSKDVYSPQLYEKYREACEEYIVSTVLPSLREKNDEFLLREFVNRWANHKVMVKWLSVFFHYLERYIAWKSLPSLHEVGLTCYRDLVYREVYLKVRYAVISLIDQERKREQIDRALLKNVLDIFVEIGMSQMNYYEDGFEATMLRVTASYYSRKASNWIHKYSFPDYMLKAEECLRREKDRVFHYLHYSSEQKLLEKVQHELLSVYATQLLDKENSGCHALLRDDKVDDLSRMYRLFSKIPTGLVLVSNIFKQHVTNEGMALVKQAEDTTSSKMVCVRKIIELHDKYLTCVKDCFANHTLFRKALREAIEDFCNKGISGSSNAELLATFCDYILKNGKSERLSDEAIEETLDRVVKLVAFISDKDLFAEFYRKKLAKRLLFDRSANDEHERSILTKLKKQCGGQFTSKMAGMVTDLTLTKEIQYHFEEYLDNNRNVNPGIDLTVTVLTTGLWPNYKSFDLNLPDEMVKCVEVFNEFYQTKMKHRKLTWIYSLGTCHIIGKFEAKNVELIVSTYQASVLLLFNASDRLSYQDIMCQLNLSDDNVVRLLHSLSCAKYKILKKEPNTKVISPTDYFEFNSKFTDKMKRIKIPLPSVDEKKKVIEDVVKDRRYAIQASIVRIMKSRKVLDYQQLVKECVEQLKCMFEPDVKVIKKSIEDLITCDYLERDKDNANLFKYLE